MHGEVSLLRMVDSVNQAHDGVQDDQFKATDPNIQKHSERHILREAGLISENSSSDIAATST